MEILALSVVGVSLIGIPGLLVLWFCAEGR
jgi:hypothetical protein